MELYGNQHESGRRYKDNGRFTAENSIFSLEWAARLLVCWLVGELRKGADGRDGFHCRVN